MARTDWHTSGYAAFSKRENCKIGFDWRYSNSEEDARINNRDIIQVKLFIIRTGDNQGWAWNNTWGDDSYFNYKIGSGSWNTSYFETRYWYGDYDKSGHPHISNNTKYYLQYTSSSSKTASKSDPFWTKSDPSRSVISGSSIYFQFTVNHKEDGTQDTVKIEFYLNGASSHGNAKATVSFTPTTIQRGTHIWTKLSSGWFDGGRIHVKGESSGDQHYIYKKVNGTWTKYYG